MKKALKIVLWVLGGIVALLVAAVATLPLWFGPVVKTAANAAVPGIVKTDFRLGHLSLNPYTARFELGDLYLANPTGYSAKDAVRVGAMIFDAETASLASDVIHIEEITLRDLFVSVVSGGENQTLNFKQIQYNAAGGKDKYEAARSEKEAQTAAEQDNPSSAEKPAAEKPAKKVIIDRLEVSGLALQLSVLPVKVPSVVLTDIGRKSEGVTMEEAWNQIVEGVMKAAGVTGDQLKALGALSGDAMKQANAVVGDAAKQVSAQTEKATTAVDGGAKAVGEGAKKALDSLKSLW